jgi:hypothetical protein
MDGFFIIFLGSLTSLLICMAVGYFCRIFGLFDDRLVSGMTALLVKVTLPCTVFVSMLRPFSSELMAESVATFFLSGAVYISGGLIALLLARLMKAEPGEMRVWQFALIFANVGYMGFPVVLAVFGEIGMMYASMANASFTLLIFTVGVRLFDTKTDNGFDWKKIVLNPALIATALGFACFIVQIRPPWPVANAISMLSAMTSPISMLLVGSILAKGKLRDVFTDLRVMPVIGVRLVVLPVTVFFVLRLFVHNPMMLGVIVVLTAMPAAAITAIFAEQYKGDTMLASKLVVVSTILCVITLPLVSLLLN